VRESTLRIMARIDALFLEDPCCGSRRMVDYLAREGIPISRDRVRNLMRRMGLRAIYQKPRTTIAGEPSERFLCLVEFNEIKALDQVWATDITYIRCAKASSIWWLWLISSPGTYSVGSSRTALTRSSVWMPWRWPSQVAASRRSSTPIRAANSPQGSLYPGCRLVPVQGPGQLVANTGPVEPLTAA